MYGNLALFLAVVRWFDNRYRFLAFCVYLMSSSFPLSLPVIFRNRNVVDGDDYDENPLFPPPPLHPDSRGVSKVRLSDDYIQRSKV